MTTEDLHELIEKFDSSSLAELRIKTADTAITMRKWIPVPNPGTAPAPFVATTGAPMPPTHGPVHHQTAHRQERQDEDDSDASGDADRVTAPIVATFYRSPSPDAPPYVEIGTQVKAGETICILEAMKVMNELEADFDMEIVSVLVTNGQMVEYGTPLFEVRRL